MKTYKIYCEVAGKATSFDCDDEREKDILLKGLRTIKKLDDKMVTNMVLETTQTIVTKEQLYCDFGDSDLAVAHDTATTNQKIARDLEAEGDDSSPAPDFLASIVQTDPNTIYTWDEGVLVTGRIPFSIAEKIRYGTIDVDSISIGADGHNIGNRKDCKICNFGGQS